MLLLDAVSAPPLPPGTPWWAAAALMALVTVMNTVGLVMAARAGRKPSLKDDPIRPIKATLTEHGSTLADHTGRLREHDQTLGEHDAALSDDMRLGERVATLETAMSELKREQREQTQARHEADARFERSLGRIEGALNPGGHDGRR